MSKFCGGNNIPQGMTTSEIRRTYSADGYTGLLPASLSNLGITNNGFELASEESLKTYVKNLQAQKIIPSPPPLKDLQISPAGSPDLNQPIRQYIQEVVKLHDQIKAEYCFYEARYQAALDRFLQNLADSSLRTNGEDQGLRNDLDLTRFMNQRLTVFTQIINAISRFNYSVTQEWNSEINNLNKTFEERAIELKRQSEILQKESAAADLHKQMVTFTTEKNKANTNLLTLYASLNVVAIAMLLYVSRSN